MHDSIAIIAFNINGIWLSQWHLDLQPSTIISILNDGMPTIANIQRGRNDWLLEMVLS